MNFLLLEADGLDAIILKIASFISDNFNPDSQPVVAHFSGTTNGVINSLSSGNFSNLVDSFVPIGCMMAMIYLSKEFLEKTTLKNIDIEQIFKMFLSSISLSIATLVTWLPLLAYSAPRNASTRSRARPMPTTR